MKNLFKAALTILKKSPVLPLRGALRKFYKRHIREKMYEDRIVLAEIDGVKHELDLSTYVGVEAYYGNWEPAMVKVIKKYVKPGMTVMDIGARIGLHTFRMKKLVGKEGKVLAIDPKKSAFKALKRTAKLNNYSVIIDNVILSDENRGREMKMDDYVKLKNLSNLDFILMDIDGGEYRVIKGGLESLKKFKPMIMLEMHPSHLGREGTEKLIDLLVFCGYSFKKSFVKEAITKKTFYTLCK